MHPVTCISIRDALAYARWLSEETGQVYRVRVRLFCVGGPEGARRGCERHGESYLTRRRRGEAGDGGGSLTGGAIPSA